MADRKKEAALLVMTTFPALMQAVAAEMRHAEHGLPMPHFGALMVLSQGPCTLSELADRRKVSLPTMSKTVALLENNGWIERVADENDRRKAELRLTTTGREIVEHVGRQMADMLVRFFDPLTTEEVAKLIDGIAVLKNVAEAQGGQPPDLGGASA
jgi:DNA-binding MarR family transcriptional regulator